MLGHQPDQEPALDDKDPGSATVGQMVVDKVNTADLPTGSTYQPISKPASLVTPMATSEDQSCLLGGDGKVDQTPPHTPERQREHGLTKYLSFFSSDCHIVL